MGRFSGIKNIPGIGTLLFNIYMLLQKKKREIDNLKLVRTMTFPRGKRVFYLDVPIHPNLGDLAQYICTKKWIKENYPDRACVEIDGLLLSDLKSGIIEKLKKELTKEDIIFFQSGYCTQDLGGYHDLVHRIIVENFCNVPIVMLPQTVFFQHVENAQRTAKVYANNSNIFFMARDFTSAEIANSLFTNLDIKTYPDIVTTLIGSKKTSDKVREGIALCIRNDSEKYYSEDKISELKKRLETLAKVSQCDTTIHEKYDEIKPRLLEVIYGMIDQFSNAKVVITDRYHGTIFSLIAGTPVIVIKTTDHKVKTGVEWFYGVYDDYVYYADTLDEAYEKAKSYLNMSLDYQLKPYFKEHYYDVLKKEIEAWQISRG